MIYKIKLWFWNLRVSAYMKRKDTNLGEYMRLMAHKPIKPGSTIQTLQSVHQAERRAVQDLLRQADEAEKRRLDIKEQLASKFRG